MKHLSSNHLLGIKNLTKDDIKLIFNITDSFKEVLSRPIKKVPTLRDITIANLFFDGQTNIVQLIPAFIFLIVLHAAYSKVLQTFRKIKVLSIIKIIDGYGSLAIYTFLLFSGYGLKK